MDLADTRQPNPKSAVGTTKSQSDLDQRILRRLRSLLHYTPLELWGPEGVSRNKSGEKPRKKQRAPQIPSSGPYSSATGLLTLTDD